MLGKGTFNREQRNSIWRLIWTSKVLPRIKLFSWRAVHGILPTSDNLYARQVEVSSVCCICGEHGESAIHVFYECMYSARVWELRWPTMLDWNVVDERRFWDQALQFWSSINAVEEGLTLCWLLWKNKNSCFHSMTCKTPSTILGTGQVMCKDFEEATIQSGPLFQQGDLRWTPPRADYFKVNMDASFLPLTRDATIGCVVRDHVGVVLGSAAAKIQQVLSPLQAELKALLYGLQMASALNYRRIVLETDCLLAVKEVQKGANSSSEWYAVIKDV
ncbi:hypothetical protein PTKIN_Ptkin16aG0054600 [Pterospermum kingtungense]